MESNVNLKSSHPPTGSYKPTWKPTTTPWPQGKANGGQAWGKGYGGKGGTTKGGGGGGWWGKGNGGKGPWVTGRGPVWAKNGYQQ